MRVGNEPLTPYAVELRYDIEFWPVETDAIDAMERALALQSFVRQLLAAET